MGHVTNQKLHSLPYKRIRELLSYKLARYGITLIAQDEAYTSQCSPLSPVVSKDYATKANRIKRGLYKDGDHIWNADAVGAYNILRLYLQKKVCCSSIPVFRTGSPSVVKVAV